MLESLRLGHRLPLLAALLPFLPLLSCPFLFLSFFLFLICSLNDLIHSYGVSPLPPPNINIPGTWLYFHYCQSMGRWAWQIRCWCLGLNLRLVTQRRRDSREFIWMEQAASKSLSQGQPESWCQWPWSVSKPSCGGCHDLSRGTTAWFSLCSWLNSTLWFLLIFCVLLQTSWRFPELSNIFPINFFST